ncbi:hypothetical protein BN2537_3379 [Streptomyces venezuelae]|nr:hypothetical protein BN2537_3379 [Streptomyces venezuelae]
MAPTPPTGPGMRTRGCFRVKRAGSRRGEGDLGSSAARVTDLLTDRNVRLL